MIVRNSLGVKSDLLPAGPKNSEKMKIRYVCVKLQ